MSGEGERPRANYDVYLGQTPGQTLGPFFHQGLLRTRAVFQVPGVCNDASDVFDHVLAPEGSAGEPIAIEGVVYDGLGQPIGDALVELWQANAHGLYHHPLDTSGKPLDPAFRGYGRAATDSRGAFAFRSVKPGAVLATGRIGPDDFYFEDDARNASDPVLSLVPDGRRATLLARAAGQRNGAALYRFDLHLQGDRETVFFSF